MINMDMRSQKAAECMSGAAHFPIVHPHKSSLHFHGFSKLKPTAAREITEVHRKKRYEDVQD